MFPNELFQAPPSASHIVKVEGLPQDATEREVSHIFRPFQGYQSVRLAPVPLASLVASDSAASSKLAMCAATFETP